MSTEQLETRQVLSAVIGPVADFEQAPAGVQIADFPASIQLDDDVVIFSMNTLPYGVELWRSNGTATGTFRLTDGNAGPGNSYPSELTKVGSKVYFILVTSDGGSELWQTDGTIAGTDRVADLSVKGHHHYISNLVAADDRHVAFTMNGDAWQSDGTSAGTMILFSMKEQQRFVDNIEFARDRFDTNVLYLTVYNASVESQITNDLLKYDVVTATSTVLYSTTTYIQLNIAYDGGLLFSANDGNHGMELWYTKGTPETTSLWMDINPGSGDSAPADFFVDGASVYFTANSADYGQELWFIQDPASDPQVIDIVPGSAPSNPSPIVVAGDKYVVTNNGIQRIIGAQRFSEPSSGYLSGSPAKLMGNGDRLYFYSYGLQYFVNGEVTNSGVEFDNFQSFVGIGGAKVIFVADDGLHGSELWSSDGTPEGTSLIIDVESGTAGSYPSRLTNLQGNLAFLAQQKSGSFSVTQFLVQTNQLNSLDTIAETNYTYTYAYVSDFSASLAGEGFQFSTSINNNGSTLRQIRSWDGVRSKPVAILPATLLPYVPTISINGATIVGAINNSGGTQRVEIWTIDDTGHLNVMLGSFYHVDGVENQSGTRDAYFLAFTGPTDYGAWRTDGTVSGTVPLSSVSNASEFDSPIFAQNFIFAETLDHRGLVFLNPDTDEVTIASGVFPNWTYISGALGDFPTNTLFVLNGNQIWQTNGTAESTKVVSYLLNLNIQTQNQATIGNIVYFFADSQATGSSSLWRTDGTDVGTFTVREFVDSSSSSDINNVAVVDDKVFFTLRNSITGYSDVWISDGTTEGTLRISTDLIINNYNNVQFVEYEGGIGFPAATPAVGAELFRIDTTIAVTPPSELMLLNRLASDTLGSGTDLVWADVLGAIQYDVWLQNLSKPSMSVVRKRVNDPRFSVLDYSTGVSNLNPNDVYRVWVRSLPVLGQPSAWSAAKDFVPGPNPVMQLVPPFNANTKPAFSWAGPADVVTYEIWLANRDTKTRTLYENGLTNTTFAVTQPLAPAKYAVWVRGTRSDGSLTEWSTVNEFVVLAPPVTLTAGAGDQKTSRPTLTWSGVNGATGYDVRVFLPDGKTLVYNVDNVNGLSHTPTQDLPAGKFIVFVRAVKNTRPFSAWSNGDALWLKLPPTNLQSSATSFAWDAVPFASSYTFELRGTNGGLYVPRNTETGTSIEFDNPLPPGKYSLRVFANFSKLSSHWSQTYSLELFHQPVNITSSAAATVDATPSISWTAAQGAASYEVVVTKPGSGLPIYDRTGIVGLSHRIDVPLTIGVSQIQVRAIYPNGSRSSLSQVQSLQIGIGSAVKYANGIVSWNAANQATNYELWINYFGVPNQRKIVYQPLYIGRSYTLPSTLPNGRYQTWLRPVRAESGQLYFGAWTNVVFDVVWP